jgi:hypothetical protein
VSVKARGVQCTMTFMVVDTDSYDVLLGLDFLIKIGATSMWSEDGSKSDMVWGPTWRCCL